MKKTLLLTFVSACWLQLNAQVASADNAMMNSFTKEEQLRRVLDQRSARNVQSFDNRYEGVKGSQFIFEDWSEGQLTLNDSAKVREQLMYKFDAMKNELWVKLPTNQQRILYNNELMAFELYRPDGKKYIFKKIKLPESNDRNHFAQIIYEGKSITLAKDIRKVFRKSNLEDKGMVTVGNAYDWFEEIDDYFIKINNSSYQKTKLKKGDIAEKMPKNQEKLIDAFCKKNHLSGKLTDDEAVTLLNYLDSLQKQN